MQCDFIFFNIFEKFFILIGNIDYFKLMRNYLLISLLLISGVVSAETMKEGVLTNVEILHTSHHGRFGSEHPVAEHLA